MCYNGVIQGMMNSTIYILLFPFLLLLCVCYRGVITPLSVVAKWGKVWYKGSDYASLTQLAECLFCNQDVEGSSPS